MALLTQILLFFGTYPELVSLIGTFLGGIETIILLSVIATQGYMNFWIVIIFSYIGIMLADIMFFFAGRTRLFNFLIRKRMVSIAYKKWDNLLDKATRGNDFQALFIAKFFYGFSIITIMHLARERLNIIEFIAYTAVINVIWITIGAVFGIFAGQGINFVLFLYDNLVISLILLGILMLSFMIILRFISDRIKSWLTKRQNR